MSITTYLLIGGAMVLGIEGVCLLVWHMVCSVMWQRERAALLDRIQSRDLPEYKALSGRPMKPVRNAPLQQEEPEITEVIPDMRPGLYPEAEEAARGLVEGI